MTTDDQKESREERIAIMMFDGKQTREAAEKYCDEFPWLYGFREDVSETQGSLL